MSAAWFNSEAVYVPTLIKSPDLCPPCEGIFLSFMIFFTLFLQKINHK